MSISSSWTSFRRHELAVDQVFALARAVQAPRHLDVARRRLRRWSDGQRSPSAREPCPWPFVGAAASSPASRTARRHAAARRSRTSAAAGGLAGVAAAEDDVLHLVAAQALGALLAKHPGDGVGDVALAAAVGADDGGDATVEGQLGAIGEGLESGDFEAFETHRSADFFPGADLARAAVANLFGLGEEAQGELCLRVGGNQVTTGVADRPRLRSISNRIIDLIAN